MKMLCLFMIQSNPQRQMTGFSLLLLFEFLMRYELHYDKCMSMNEKEKNCKKDAKCWWCWMLKESGQHFTSSFIRNNVRISSSFVLMLWF